MAFEKCKNFSIALENACDALEHSGVKGMKRGMHLMAKDEDYVKWLLKNGESVGGSVPIGQGEDADGVDEYGAYHLDENGEKSYDLGDGDSYYYTDGYFRSKTKPGVMKKWDEAIGAYVDAAPPEEEVYPAPGEEDKPAETKTEEAKEEPKESDSKAELKEAIEKHDTERKRMVEPTQGGAQVVPIEPDVPKDRKPMPRTFLERAKDRAKRTWANVSKSFKDTWTKIRDKLRHGEMLDEEEYAFLAHCGIQDRYDFDDLIENIEDDEYLAHFYEPEDDELYHYGILEQRWGVRRGPPYPLKRERHSDAEVGAQYVKQYQNKPAPDIERMVSNSQKQQLDKFASTASSVAALASAAATVYNATSKAETWPEEMFDPNMRIRYPVYDKDGNPKRSQKNGNILYEEKFVDVETLRDKVRNNVPLTPEEMSSLERRKKEIEDYQRTFKTDSQKNKQAVVDALQTLGALISAGATIATAAKAMKS